MNVSSLPMHIHSSHTGYQDALLTCIGWRQILENARVLHSRQHDQVSPNS